MSIRRSLATVAVCVGVLAAAAPASAQQSTTTVPFSAAGAFGYTSVIRVDTANTISEKATGQTLVNDNVTEDNISVECISTATPALAVDVDRCFLKGKHDLRTYEVPSPGALPGPVNARFHAVLTVPKQPYWVCMRTEAFFQSGTNYWITPITCY